MLPCLKFYRSAAELGLVLLLEGQAKLHVARDLDVSERLIEVEDRRIHRVIVGADSGHAELDGLCKRHQLEGSRETATAELARDASPTG